MTRDEPNVASETRGFDAEETPPRPSITGSESRVGTARQPVYRGRRDPTAPVGEECTVTVDGEALDCRYDLLSASPSGPEWGYGGSGPAQLAIALLADAYGDAFACEHYQEFKRDIVAELPEDGWVLTKADLDAWRQGVIG